MKTTSVQIRIACAIGMAAFAFSCASFADDKSKEETVKLENCPAAVQQAIQDHAAGGKIIEVEKETLKDGTVVYEAEVKKSDGKKVDVKVTSDGKLIPAESDDEAGGKQPSNEKE